MSISTLIKGIQDIMRKDIGVDDDAQRISQMVWLIFLKIFEDAYNYMKSGTLLRQVINAIEEQVDFNKSGDRHLFKDIYEKILSDLQAAGNAGEYYTPRAVTQFMVDMLDPRIRQTILDPVCGTGGILTCV